MILFKDRYLKAVDKYADKLAYSDPTSGCSYTYAQFDSYVRRIASKLKSAGMGKGDVLAVALPHNVDYIAVMYACILSGICYVPLSDTYPKDRIDMIVEDSGAKAIADLTMIGGTENIEEMMDLPSAGPEDRSLIIYTSGSTGRPKGVIQDHKGLIKSIDRYIKIVDLKEGDIYGSNAPFYFVVHMQDAFAAFFCGASTVLIPEELRGDPKGLAGFIDKESINSTYISPKVLKYFSKDGTSLKRLMTAGERASDIVGDGFTIVNGYGMSETASAIMMYVIDRKYDNTPIGRPVGSEVIHILDDSGNEADEGELCVAGDLSAGYCNLPELTAETFIKNPFEEDDGYPVLLRTGDLVKRLPSGDVLFMSRKDWMIKINGQRVEPGEIEAALKKVDRIKDACVKDHTRPDGQTVICAYYVSDEEISEDVIKASLSERLPSYMIPAYYAKMDKLPVNANGKLDRKALVLPDLEEYRSEYTAPSTPEEEEICNAFAEILSVGKVGIDDDFFALGGDSIKTLVLQNRLDRFGITKTDIFAMHTPRRLAERIGSAVKGNDTLSGYVSASGKEVKKAPLTESQLSVYLDSQDPSRACVYNNALGLFLPQEGKSGDEKERLVKAAEDVLKSYPILKCRIDDSDGVPSLVLDEGIAITVECVKTETCDREEIARSFIRPFDLNAGPLVRASVFEMPVGLFLIIDVHHIISDGTSISLMFDNISRAFSGKELICEQVTGLVLASYENDSLAEVKEADNEYYRAVLDNMDGDTELYPDDDPDIRALDGKLGMYTAEISKLDDQKVRSYGITESTIFFAAYAYLIRLLSGQKNVLVFAGENGRNDPLLNETFGMMVHNIPILVNVDETLSCADYLGKVQQQFYDCIAHDAAAFSQILSEYHIRPAHTFVYQGDMLSGIDLDGRYIPLEFYKGDEAMEDLTLHVLRLPGGSHELRFEYNAGLFTEDTIKRFASLYIRLTEGLVSSDKLCGITLVGTEDIIEQNSHNATERDYEITDVVSLFRKMVRQHPDNNAVCFKGEMLSYKQVDDISDRIASFLRSKGIGEGKVVSILIPRSPYMVTASLGVLKTGAAYQPLDPSYPSERLTFMMQDASAAYLITDESLLGSVPEYRGEVLLTRNISKLPAGKKSCKNGPDADSLFILLYTSGSTGTPKGVKLLHRNIANFCGWYREFYELDETSRVAAYASYGFDADMMDLYPALTTGSCVYIAEEEIRLDLIALETWFNTNAITHSFMTTQVGRQFYTMAKVPTLKFLSTGGEKLVPLNPVDGGVPFYNVYGPTECTILTTGKLMDRLYARVPIGSPIGNYKVFVRDEFGRQLPALVPGELLICGAGVGAGYLNRPDLTEKVFVKNEFTDEPGYERAYRSGDVVRLLANGEVDFIGRNDGQVKVRGFRIELTEVEAVIREFEGIKDATVQALEDESSGEKYIVAYIVADSEIDINALNDHIRSEKPPYMVPTVTMQIDAIPLNQNQKVNRKALPKPVRQVAELVPPQNDMQQKIFDCVADVVGHNEFGITTTLSEAGLSSIGSIKLNAILSRTFDCVFTTRDLKEQNTVEKLEKFITGSADIKDEHKPDFTPRSEYPLSKTQEGVYVECISKPDTTAYNIPILLSIDPAIDTDKLRKAVVSAVDAHPFIKTRLSLNDDGDVMMKRMDGDYSYDENSIEVISVPSIDEIKSTLVTPFKLVGGRLFRIKIIKTDDKGLYIFIEMHHLISDGTSLGIFLDDISKAYAGEELAVESFTGYEVVVNEEHLRTAKVLEETKRYYESLLDEAETQSLPSGDVDDGTGEADENGRNARVLNTDGVYAKVPEIRKYCEDNGLSMNAFFSTAFGHLLNGYLNTEKVVFAGIYNGRSDSRLERTCAMLVKTLPIVIGAKPGDTVAEYVKSVGTQLLDTQANDIYSFAEVSRQLGVNADVMFAYQGDEFIFDTFCGSKSDFILFDLDAEKAPLNVTVYLKGDAVNYNFEYSALHYSDEYIRAMASSFDLAVSQMISRERMSEITFTTDEMIEELDRFNDTKVKVNKAFAPDLMRQAAEKYADNVAVISCSGQRQITYKELDLRSNKIANTLLSRGIKKNSRIGLYMERNEDVYAIRQGVMKAGSAFVNLEPDYPDERISFIICDAGIKLLITTEEMYSERRQLFDGIVEVIRLEDIYSSDISDKAPEKVRIRETDPAYCIYTSGSTGNPKGVEITHKNLRNLLDYNDKNEPAHVYVDNSTRFLALAAITFDVSIIEEMMPLFHGRTVVMATEDEIHNPMLLVDTMKKTGVDMFKCTPSYMLSILEIQDARAVFEQLNAVILGAEPFPKGMYEKLRDAGFKGIVFNSYGPTETCVSVSVGTLDGSYVTIGGPNANTAFVIRDRFGNVLPKYMRGELVIAGDCVGNGYVGLPEKTKEVFISLPGNVPAYRSGDIAYFNRKGEIMHCGRNDNQVKIRGLRVELDGIENTMNTFPGVVRSVVLVAGEGDGKYLIGYYVAKHPVDENALADHLRKTLTAYMVPGVFVYLESLPLTVNGKVNKKALPKPELKKKASGGKAASNDLQKEIADMFAKALGVDSVGVDEDFFELGGTSMLASKVAMSAMVKGLPIAYKDIFSNTTVLALEEHVRSVRGESASADSAEKAETPARPVQDGSLDSLLAMNSLKYIDEIENGYSAKIGTVLLTGATGFLGIHVLGYLLEHTDSKIYCLIRKGKYESADKRMKFMLMYYFDKPYNEAFDEGRIVTVDGDITDKDKLKELEGADFDIVINCAACVKHFASDDILERVNVTGVKNLIDLCSVVDKPLIQISTVSVAGENVDHALPDHTVMDETMLYFGQDLSNQYIKSKFDAEQALLTAVAKGSVKGKVIRVGNLMSRASDGEFQANSITSGFMRNLRGYAAIGAYPVSAMARPVEFSPIDIVAESVIKLAVAPDVFTLFHSVNGHWIEMGDLIAAMNKAGLKVDVVSDAEFEARLKEALADESKNMVVSGLISYLSSDAGSTRSYIPEEHTFTKNVLYRMGFMWPLTDESYLVSAIEALITMGFFDGEDVDS